MSGVIVVQAVDAPAIEIILVSAPVAGKGYTVGGAAQITTTTLDANGNPYTPTSVLCTVTDPAGNVSTPTTSGPTGTASNVFTTLVPFPTLPGAYTYKVTAQGGPLGLQGGASGFLQVNP